MKSSANSLLENSFLGRGWKFPVLFQPETGTVQMVQDEEDIKESLQILLATIVGERVMRPDYGANLEDMTFEPINVTTATIISNRIKRAILFHEPRVKAHEVQLVPDLANGLIEVAIDYTVISTNTRTNMVYPYYFTEATDIRK